VFLSKVLADSRGRKKMGEGQRVVTEGGVLFGIGVGGREEGYLSSVNKKEKTNCCPRDGEKAIGKGRGKSEPKKERVKFFLSAKKENCSIRLGGTQGGFIVFSRVTAIITRELSRVVGDLLERLVMQGKNSGLTLERKPKNVLDTPQRVWGLKDSQLVAVS